MRDSEKPPDTIFKKGIKLGKELERIQDVTQRWKVMADFWAEMMLFVAPSDNVKEHMEQLAKGGEFITHLWALLSHAGILEKNQQSPSHPNAENTQNSSDHQETAEDSAIHEAGTDSSLRRRIVVDPLPSHWDPPPPGVQAGQPAPEIVTASERRIDIPKAMRSM